MTPQKRQQTAAAILGADKRQGQSATTKIESKDCYNGSYYIRLHRAAFLVDPCHGTLMAMRAVNVRGLLRQVLQRRHHLRCALGHDHVVCCHGLFLRRRTGDHRVMVACELNEIRVWLTLSWSWFWSWLDFFLIVLVGRRGGLNL